MKDDDLERLLEGGHELRSLEFKPPFLWATDHDHWIRERIVRAILAMSNTRNGGNVVVGITQKDDETPEIAGLAADQLASFERLDAIKGHVDGFSHLPTAFSIKQGSSQGKELVVFAVTEFEQIPLICRRNGQDGTTLRDGDVYVRSAKAPFSSMRATHIEMIEIVEMAADKNASRLRRRGWRLGPELDLDSAYNERIRDLG
jgi:predicted HTH transcriptional regulator